MTYSIVARDTDSGQMGVAAQSFYFALGRVLPWARAGVGAVATQSFVEPGYGPSCLDLMAGTGSGDDALSAADALEQVRAADDGREVRQVGVVDAQGRVASFTGSQCIDHVSHAEGEGFTAQANMMAGAGVCEAMADAFVSTGGPLAERLVAALVAAEGKGGDARGKMSAALIVVDAARTDHLWQGVLTDVRVDHHPDPLAELARLVQVARAYHLVDVAEEALVRGDAANSLADTEAGLALLPGDGNLHLGHIASLVWVGRVDEATAEVRRLVAQRPEWDGVLRALFERGLVPLPEGVTMDALLGDSTA